MDQIAKYLNHSDLKALSETCSWIFTLTRQCEHFRNRSQLRLIDQDEIQSKDLSFAHLSTSFRWKTIRLTVGDWDENQLQQIKMLVFGSDAIQSLILTDPGWDWDEPEPEPLRDPTKQLSGEELTVLLCQVPNLKSITLSIEVLVRISSKRLTNQLQERLSALKDLRIHWVSNDVHCEEKVAAACECIRVLSKVPKMRLQRFKYECWTRDEDLPNYPSVVSAVIELIDRHQNTLEDLALDSDEIWNADEMAGRMRFPSLKTLSLRTLKFQAQERSANFLDEQALLEGLHIHYCQRNLELFRAIQKLKLIEGK